MKTRVIFASLILGLGLAATQADAATTTNTDDSPAASKPASTMLVNGTQTQFAVYVGHNLGKFAQTTDWVNFMNVIILYNQNPTAVLTLSPTDRARFNQATVQVINTLAKQKDAQASQWMKQANHTARLINFLWDVNLPIVDTAEVIDIQ